MTSMYVYTYFLTTILCSCVAFVIRQHANYETGSEQVVKAFRSFITFYILFVLSNGICLWCNYYSWVIAGYIFSTVNLLSLFLSAYFWFIYVERKLGMPLTENLSERVVFIVPAIFCAGLILTTPLTHLIFYYSADGAYTRGDLYFILLCTGFFYLLLAAGRARQGMKEAKTAAQKKEYLYLMLFLIFPIAAGVIDLLIPHLPIMELVMLLAIVLIYLTLQQSQIYTDALTGLNNRRMTDEYFEQQVVTVNEEDPLYIFLADINNFKMVNDRYGHVEGDHALRAVSAELKKYADATHCHVARWGGDEFILIARRPNVSGPDAVTQALHRHMEYLNRSGAFPFMLSLSIGCAEHTDPGKRLEVSVHEADQDMYANKQRALSSNPA